MAREKCTHLDCDKWAGTFVGGEPMCSPHGLAALQQIVLLGPEDQNPPWLNVLGRFIEITVPYETRRGLTKAKVECRTRDITWESPVAEFSIERHPAGFIYEQRWRFDASRMLLELLRERLVSTEMKVSADGRIMCPKCHSIPTSDAGSPRRAGTRRGPGPNPTPVKGAER
jgi:hypothetical protein